MRQANERWGARRDGSILTEQMRERWLEVASREKGDTE